MASLHFAKSTEDFEKLLSELSVGNLVVAYFHAEWAPECKQMNEVVAELQKDKELQKTKFIKVEAEELQDLSMKYHVASVPTFIFIINKKALDKLEGANAPKLLEKVKGFQSRADIVTPTVQGESNEHLNTRLKRLINHSPCMLFMKGNPEEPQCGFSRQVVALLKGLNVNYNYFDILADNEVRQGLKEFSNWPTYPQLYLNGELIGGLDILKELAETGELQKMLPQKEDLNQRLKNLINQAPVMVFMKGSPETPRCGFSRTLIGILSNTGVKYETFDILNDDEVRQGLKAFSNWPTYPQIYVNGNLIGGLDIIKELESSGELVAALKGQ